MSTLQHKQIKSQKQHLKILWGWGAERPTYGAEGRVPSAEKNKYPFIVNDI